MLCVGGIDIGAVDLRIDVTVGHEDVEPAIVVHVEEAYAPAEETRVDAETGEIGVIVEVAVAEVEVERIGVTSEVGLDDVEKAVPIEVSDGDAHACLRFAIGGICDAGFDSDIFEGAVLLVLIKGGGSGIVGDVDVGPPVVVEDRRQPLKEHRCRWYPTCRFLGDVGERAVAVVAVENVFTTLQTRGAAGYLDTFIGTACRFGERCGLDVEVDVVRNEEIEMTIAVVVEKGTAGVPACFRLEQACFSGDIGEGAVTIVTVEDVLAVVANKEIVPTVVVVVADTAALAPAAVGKAGFGGDVGERAVPVVLEEMRDGFLALRKSLDAGTVDEEDVDPVVVIVVEEGYSATRGFKQISVLMFTTVDRFGIEAGLTGYIDEADTERCAGDSRRGPFGAGRGLTS